MGSDLKFVETLVGFDIYSTLQMVMDKPFATELHPPLHSVSLTNIKFSIFLLVSHLIFSKNR